MTRGSVALACALVCGLVLRMLWPADMEWKADEQWMFARASTIGISEPWPPVGMPSGVAVPNPGLSVWIFVPLARAAGDPVRLAQFVQLINVLALVGLALLGVSRALPEASRHVWFAGLALMSVNPLAVVLARKIWAQSLLPLFAAATFAAHASRFSFVGAFTWGLAGTLAGQVHMSGFFLQAALALWTWLSEPSATSPRTRWSGWFSGSVVGAIPLFPWALHLLRSDSQFSRDWIATLIPRAPFTWLVDSLGVNTPYVYRPETHLFLAEPRVGGVPTYGMAVAHAALAAIALYCLARWARTMRPRVVPAREDGHVWLWIHAAAFGLTTLLMIAGVRARTHYLVIAYPLPFVWLAWLLLTHGGIRLYRAALALQLAITITLVLQVHRDGGVANGAYGRSYRAQIQSTNEHR